MAIVKRCPDCGHNLAQYDAEDGQCFACGHACSGWQDVEVAGLGERLKKSKPPVGHRHPKTSIDAANSLLPRYGTRRREVFDLIHKSADRGMTDDELEDVSGRSHQTVSATRNTLMNDGLIADSGQRRPTRYGNEAIVWVVQPSAFGV
jgi:hypothetical protein